MRALNKRVLNLNLKLTGGNPNVKWLHNELFVYGQKKGTLILEQSYCDVDGYFTFYPVEGDAIKFDTAYVYDAKGIDHTEAVKNVLEIMYITSNFNVNDYDGYF